MTLPSLLALLAALQAGAADTGSAVPQRLAPAALGQDGRITLSPGFSPDGQIMVFAQSECGEIGRCPQRLKLTRRTADGWSTPVLIERTAAGRVDYPSVAPDGRTVLFSWAVPRARHEDLGVREDFDLYRMDLFDVGAAPEPIDEPDINRVRGGRLATLRFVHNETAPVLTGAGDLYFWTERLDGPGERDVYVAEGDGTGGFRAPVPVSISGAGREDGAWVSPDGKLMLLSMSGRADGAGGGDLYLSRRVGGPAEWSAPVSLGAVVNSAYGDGSARITPDGEHLVFSSTRPFGGQAQGLWQVWTVPVAAVPVLAEALGSE